MSRRSSSPFEVLLSESAVSMEREMLGEVWKFGRSQNSDESCVPAPPRGYIHLEEGMPRDLAVVVEVRMTADARLTVLKAFISRGSAEVSHVHSKPQHNGERLTRIANHPVLRPNRTNYVLANTLPLTPRILIFLRHLCEFSIELRALLVIRFQALAAMSPERILIQRIHMNRSAYLVYGAEICRFVS